MVIKIKDIIEEAKSKEIERRKNIEKQIYDALKKYSGVSFLEKGYYELKIPSGGLNDRIAELVVDEYQRDNPDMEISYRLVNENEGYFYRFSFELK